MSKTVLANPGSIGLSIAGEADKFKVIANILIMGARLVGYKITDEMIGDALRKEKMEVNTENLNKVKSFIGESYAQ